MAARVATGAIIVLMIVSFLPLPGVHAAVIVQQCGTSSANNASNTLSCTFGSTPGTTNIIVVAVGALGAATTFSSVAETGVTFTGIAFQAGSSFGATEFFYSTAIAAPGTTVTVTASGNDYLGIVAYEVSGMNSGGVTSSTGVHGNSGGTPQPSVASYTLNGMSFAVSAQDQSALGIWSPTTNFALYPYTGQVPTWAFDAESSGTVTGSSTVPMSYSNPAVGGGFGWTESSVSFVASTTTTTTTSTTTIGAQTLGNCGSKDTTTTTLVNNTLYFYALTNVIGGQVINFTIALGPDSYSKAENMLIGWYALSSNLGFPTYFLQNSYTASVGPNINHGTITFNPSTFNPAATTAGGNYLMMIAGTSHMKVNQSTGTQQMYKLTFGAGGAGVPGTGLPASLLQSAGPVPANNASPPLFFCAVITAQAGGGIGTTTTTITSVTTVTTTTTINQAGLTTNINAYIAILLIVGLFLIMAKVGGIAGAIFGAIIGVITSIVGGFITGPFATLAIIAVMIGAVALVYVGRSSGSAGGQGGV